jgi:hypothetical protein
MARFDPAVPLVHPLPDPDRVELRPGLAYAEAGFDAVVAEVVAAVAAVRDRAGDLGLNPDRQALAAFSAGVPLAA